MKAEIKGSLRWTRRPLSQVLPSIGLIVVAPGVIAGIRLALFAAVLAAGTILILLPLALPLGLALLTAPLEQASVRLGRFNVRPTYLLAGCVLGSLALQAKSDSQRGRQPRRYSIIGGCACVCLATIIQHRLEAVAAAVLIGVNVANYLAVTRGLAALSERVAMRLAILAMAIPALWVALEATMVLVGVTDRESGGALEFLGRGVRGPFAEVTWAGIFLGFVVMAAVACNHRFLAFLLLCLLSLMGARTALICCVLSLFSYVVQWRGKFPPTILARTAIVVALAWTPLAALHVVTSDTGSSLTTRSLDMHTVLSDQRSPIEMFAGNASAVFVDKERSRALPTTQNNAIVDAFAKFGILGVAAVGSLMVWATQVCGFGLGASPGRETASWSPGELAVRLYIVFSIAAGVLNNAFVRPWFWSCVAILLFLSGRLSQSNLSKAPSSAFFPDTCSVGAIESSSSDAGLFKDGFLGRTESSSARHRLGSLGV